MKLWSMNGFGRDQLRLSEAAPPSAAAGQVLIRVANVSLNYRDLLVLEGKMGWGLSFPFTPGSDVAGTVAACGEGARRFAVGERVMSYYVPGWIDGVPPGSAAQPNGQTLGGPLQGFLAEYAVVPEGWLVKAPATLDDAAVSTLPIAGVTAWSALIETGKLRAGQTVLVQGTGGVALFGVQIARAHGARVIVTSGDDSKLQRVKSLGADVVINRLREDWPRAVLEATNGWGADHILEIVGGPNLAKSVEVAAPGGQISVIGILEGTDLGAPAFPLMLKQVTIRGIFVGHRRSAEDFVTAVDTIGLKPVIDARYPLAALPEALKHLERGPFGKIVIDVA
jgi:NADPH:quinone reductase-like Zn-dependent oxidoreductase